MNTSEKKQTPPIDVTTGKKPLKPSYNQFLQDLKVITEDKKIKNPIALIFKHLKRGFQEQVTHQHIEEIVTSLVNGDYFYCLAIKIAISGNSGRSPAIFKKLTREIKEKIAQQIEFPNEVQIHTNHADSERKEVLESWVRSQVKDGALDYDWARKAILCLINEDILEKDLEIIQLIVENCVKPKKLQDKKIHVQKPISNYKEYSNQLIKLFLSKEVPKGRIANLITFFTFSKNVNKGLIDEKSELAERCDNLEYKLNNLKIQFDETKETLEKTAKKKTQLESLLIEKEHAVKKEQDRYKDLEQYWEKESSTRVAKQKLSFIKDFKHEIQEARLSLEGETPDIAMALSRIKHMEDYLAKYGDIS